MEKTYSPQEVETRHYERWEKNGAFAAHADSNKTPYTIMMPPPNVTGSLHMGHALTFTLQDVLIRYERMKGKDALWQPGTDHAGIATQMVVERQLAEKKISRHDLGREKFLEKVWEWKAESGGTITRQLRRLGASADWPRERFTMDEGLNKAVNKVFVDLYRQGLIYKDKRLVNWDPKLLTAISDLEVEQRDMKGSMWHFRYPLADNPSQHIVVATTRPETMLGDSAVAVHPEDERYKALIGKMVKLPITGRLIPIIADEYANPEKGSGAVKITPAHDFNDFAVWQRHREEAVFTQQIEGGLINIFDAHAKVNENAPQEYRGLDRFVARKQIVAKFEELELLEKIEPIANTVPHGDRSGVVIEPWLTEQWYCNAEVLAQPAIEAVKSGKTQFVPQQWENTYFEWMNNIQPWCISRQLWWGHQIPAWYDADGQFYVAETEAEAQAEAGAGVKLTRDQDVLDTWFSSALWPFSTLGWPEKTAEVNRYYPGDVLVTGFDIIFFWVARMMMMGIHFMNKDQPLEQRIPFKKIYIHALVRDEKGQKMSKTKGNVIDPLDMIDKYGTDALRFTLTALSTPGRDIRLATGRIEGGRNFATKLWNAARFCEMNECAWVEGFDPASIKQTVNRWIVGETNDAIRKATKALDIYRFDEAANGLYQFAWTIFCDWYLEFAKPMMQGSDLAAKNETRATVAWLLNTILHLLHPIMPYITEEIAGSLRGDKTIVMLEEWPQANPALDNAEALKEMRWVIEAISIIRSVRSELNVPAGANIQLIVQGADAEVQRRLDQYRDFIFRMARIANMTLGGEVPKGSAQAVLGATTFVLPLADVIDLGAERARLEKECGKLAEEIARLDQKLKNPQFTDKAPSEVVEEHQQRLAEARTTLANLDAARSRLTA
jgi:valyl-tRNA synthetase